MAIAVMWLSIAGFAEIRAKMARAFARWSSIPRAPYNWLLKTLSGIPVCSAAAFVNEPKNSCAAGPQPPRDSAIIGTKRTPSAAQRSAVRLSASLSAS